MKSCGKVFVLVIAMMLSASAHSADVHKLANAVENRDEAEVESLLSEGVDINAKDQDGWTALHWVGGDKDLRAVAIEGRGCQRQG